MSTARERLLIEGVRKRLIGIQKAKSIYKELAKWEEHVLRMDERGIDSASKQIARKCEIFFQSKERFGEEPSVEVMEKKIKEELKKI